MKKFHPILFLLLPLLFVGCEKEQPQTAEAKKLPYDLQVYKLIYHARKTVGEIKSEAGMNTRDKFNALCVLVAEQVKTGLSDDAFYLARKADPLIDKTILLSIIGEEQRKLCDTEAAYKTVKEAAETFPGWSNSADTKLAFDGVVELFVHLGKIDEAIDFHKKHPQTFITYSFFKSILDFATEQKDKNKGRAIIIEAINKVPISRQHGWEGAKNRFYDNTNNRFMSNSRKEYYIDVAIALNKLGFHNDAKKIFARRDLYIVEPAAFLVGAIETECLDEAGKIAADVAANDPVRYARLFEKLGGPRFVDKQLQIQKALDPIINDMVDISKNPENEYSKRLGCINSLVKIGCGNRIISLTPLFASARNSEIITIQVEQMIKNGEIEQAKAFLDACLENAAPGREVELKIATGFVAIGEIDKANELLRVLIPKVFENTSEATGVFASSDRYFFVQILPLLYKCGMTEELNAFDAKYPDMKLRDIYARNKAKEQMESGDYEAAFQTYKSLAPSSRYVLEAEPLINYLAEKREYELAIKYFTMSDPDCDIYDEKLAKIADWQVKLHEHAPKKHPLSEAIRTAEKMSPSYTKVYWYCRLADLYRKPS